MVYILLIYHYLDFDYKLGPLLSFVYLYIQDILLIPMIFHKWHHCQKIHFVHQTYIIQDNHNRSIAFAKTIIDILLEMIYSLSRGLTIIGNNCQFFAYWAIDEAARKAIEHFGCFKTEKR